MTAIFLTSIALFALCSSAGALVQMPQARSSPAKIPLCSCEEQQRFFDEELKPVLRPIHDKCFEEIQAEERAQLGVQDPKQLDECFMEEVTRSEAVVDCLHKMGQKSKSCSPGAAKGPEIANVPSTQVLAYHIDKLAEVMEAEYAKITKKAGDTKFGPVYQKHTECIRQSLVQKLPLLDLAQSMQCELNFSNDWMVPAFTSECMSADRYRQTVQKTCQCAIGTKASGAKEFCGEAQKSDYFSAAVFKDI